MTSPHLITLHIVSLISIYPNSPTSISHSYFHIRQLAHFLPTPIAFSAAHRLAPSLPTPRHGLASCLGTSRLFRSASTTDACDFGVRTFSSSSSPNNATSALLTRTPPMMRTAAMAVVHARGPASIGKLASRMRCWWSSLSHIVEPCVAQSGGVDNGSLGAEETKRTVDQITLQGESHPPPQCTHVEPEFQMIRLEGGIGFGEWGKVVRREIRNHYTII
ncbi:unnamed protein product [Protopolystoma xenopodis]|uniref:Uncharacterized protein n=1 Tax=Protopolystoma xenopodis TaxID=117903 RepID=A0A448X7D6_9PLAT|nr:unnamed protein product [Protopolystoma xenopodis]